nr:hypothetical protein [Candidatus Sigynarchaeota archaeon]
MCRREKEKSGHIATSERVTDMFDQAEEPVEYNKSTFNVKGDVLDKVPEVYPLVEESSELCHSGQDGGNTVPEPLHAALAPVEEHPAPVQAVQDEGNSALGAVRYPAVLIEKPEDVLLRTKPEAVPVPEAEAGPDYRPLDAVCVQREDPCGDPTRCDGVDHEDENVTMIAISTGGGATFELKASENDFGRIHEIAPFVANDESLQVDQTALRKLAIAGPGAKSQVTFRRIHPNGIYTQLQFLVRNIEPVEVLDFPELITIFFFLRAFAIGVLEIYGVWRKFFLDFGDEMAKQSKRHKRTFLFLSHLISNCMMDVVGYGTCPACNAHYEWTFKTRPHGNWLRRIGIETIRNLDTGRMIGRFQYVLPHPR